MKNWFLGAALLLLAGVYACTNHTAEAAARWDEVIALHDEVMPKMSAIHQTSKALKSLQSMSDSLGIAAADQDKISAQVAALQAADDAMMEWMNGFLQLERLQRDKSHQEVMEYLDNEEGRIKAVKEAMESSIAAGQALLNELQTTTQE